MTDKQPEALRLAEFIEGRPHRSGDAAIAAELRRLHAENQKLLTLLEDVEYALDYAADMTKPEGLSGCDCPICLTSIKVSAALAGKRSTQ